MSEPEPIDTTDTEDAQLLLADPDDYHRSQRLRQIHDARREVHKTLREIERYTSVEDHNLQRTNLADAVSAYITELQPLIETTDYDDTLDHTPWDTIREYSIRLGRHPDKDEMAGYEHSMFVFREANQFLSEVKPLIEPDENNEWEV